MPISRFEKIMPRLGFDAGGHRVCPCRGTGGTGRAAEVARSGELPRGERRATQVVGAAACGGERGWKSEAREG